MEKIECRSHVPDALYSRVHGRGEVSRYLSTTPSIATAVSSSARRSASGSIVAASDSAFFGVGMDFQKQRVHAHRDGRAQQGAG